MIKEEKKETCLIFGFIFLDFCDVRKLFFPMLHMGRITFSQKIFYQFGDKKSIRSEIQKKSRRVLLYFNLFFTFGFFQDKAI